MAGFWDDDSFRDGMDAEDEETVGERGYQGPVIAPRQPKPSIQQVIEEVQAEVESEDEPEDFTEVLSDARLRLEQGRLYEMLMNHDLFEGMQADARAMRNVQREIRQYARERMEIMLGMRAPEPKVAVVSSPFNEVEVEVLKMIAKAASKGKSEQDQPTGPARTTLAPLAPKVDAPAKIQPIAAPTPKKAAPRPAPKKVVKTQPALPPKASKPIDRKKQDLIDRVAREEGVPKHLLMDALKQTKDPSLMTEDERIEHNKTVSKRLVKQAKSTEAMPMPTYDQQVMKFTQQAAEVASGPMSLLLNAVAKKTK